jgi:Protein-disulfide isomerase
MRSKAGFILYIVAALLAVFASFYSNARDPAGRDLYTENYSPMLGDIRAPVTIVEFFDPACEGCAAMSPYVKSLLEKYDGRVRLVLRYAPFHGEASRLAVKILEASRDQEMFLPVLNTFFRTQNIWASHSAPSADSKTLWQLAASAGLDVVRAKSYLEAEKVDDLITEDIRAVETLGIRGTPTFYVNGRRLDVLGPQQLENLVVSQLNLIQ